MRRLFSTLLLAAPLLSATPRADKTYQVGRIETRLGEILFVLYDQTPHHKASFIKLAGEHYWDTLTFNRVIKNFVAQGGCPDTPKGFSHSPYLLAPEFRDSLRHVYGAVGAGRRQPAATVRGVPVLYRRQQVRPAQARPSLHGVRTSLQGNGCGRGHREPAHRLDEQTAHAHSAAHRRNYDDGRCHRPLRCRAEVER